jgi:hypothetical protein
MTRAVGVETTRGARPEDEPDQHDEKSEKQEHKDAARLPRFPRTCGAGAQACVTPNKSFLPALPAFL